MSDIAIPYDVQPHPLTRMYNGKFGIWLFLASEIMLFGALFSSYVLLRVGAPPGTWPMYGLTAPQGDQILNVPLATLNTVFLITSSVTMVLAWASLKMKDLAKGRLYLLLTFLLAGGFLVIKYFEYSAKLTHHQVVLRDAPPDELKGVISAVPVKGAVGETIVYFVNGHITENDKEKDYLKIVPDPKKDENGKAVKDAAHGKEIQIDRALVKRATNWGPQASTYLGIYFMMTGLHGLHVIGGMIVILYLYLTAGTWWKKMPDKLVNRVECTGLYWHFVDLVWIFLFPVLYLL